MSLESMLAALTPSEKLAALDLLWRHFSERPAEFPSPAWHGAVLDARLAQPSAEPSLPLQAAFEDVRERLHARRTPG